MSKYTEAYMIQPDIKCSECGNYVLASEIEGESNGKPQCKICFCDNFICDKCKEICDKDDCRETDEGKLCEECYDDIFDECYNCNDDYKIEDMIRYNGDYYCQECHDEQFRVCQHCENSYDIDDMYITDIYTLCDECRNEYYFHCNECSNMYLYEEVFRHSGHNYCEPCFNIIRTRNNGYPVGRTNYSDAPTNKAIHSYGYKPKITFSKVPKEKKKETLFFGIELEVAQGGYNDSNAIKINKLCKKLYIKSDCSVTQGFELVTHPCTYRYHLEKFPWKKILTKCRELGYVSHKGSGSGKESTTGIHIHVSKKFFGLKNDTERDEKILNLLILVNWNLWEQVYKFSRRTQKTIRWGKRYNELYQPMGLLNEGKKGKRACVHICPKDTIEFRFFRGTLDYTTFIANIQFIRMLCELSTALDRRSIERVKWDDVLNYATDNDFTEFMKYCGTRKLLE